MRIAAQLTLGTLLLVAAVFLFATMPLALTF